MTVTDKKIIVVTAPSGSGKTTLVKRLLQHQPRLGFSASACTRKPRPGEIDGKDYNFLTEEDFKKLIEEDAFVEWEMVYFGKYYGTLKSEMERIWNHNQYPLIDIDVQGALNIKKQFGDRCLSIFIQAPSIEELRKRLQHRGTENETQLEERIAKAKEELSYRDHFDEIVINTELSQAEADITTLVHGFLGL